MAARRLVDDRLPVPLAADAFCGAGGLSAGLRRAGFHVALEADNWAPAVATVNANHGTAWDVLDVASLTAADVRRLAGETPALLAGGPPCQGFTSAGARRPADPRNTLVGRFALLAAELGAQVVVFENVEGFLTAGEGRFVRHLLDPLVDAGYRVVLRKVNLANYGVPQHRKRAIAVAVRAGDPPFPAPTHRAHGAPGAQARSLPWLPPAPNILDALGDLPQPGTPQAPQSHTAPPPGGLDAERCAALAPGQTMRDLPEHLQHASYRRRAFRRVMDGTPSERRGGAPAGLRRLRGDEPSKAVTAAASREFVHPTADRRLTLRECARLQTFPDDFVFCGTTAEQATLIGNAVPPLFAERLASAVLAHLADAPDGHDARGGVCEFDVTNGGMSPALRTVAEAVAARYRTSPQLALL